MFDFVGEWITEILRGIAENVVLENLIVDQVNKDYGLFAAGGIVETIANSLKPVGFAMCALFFIMALYDLAMQDRFDLEMFIKFFTKLVIGAGVVLFANDFTNLGFGFSNWVESKLLTMGSSKSLEQTLEQARNLNSNVEGLKALVSIGLIGLLLQIVFAIVGACITVACFSRLLEMALRACFMPVALGLVSEDGLKGAGGRYIKRYIALCVQGPAFIIIARLHSEVVCFPLGQFVTEMSSGGDLLASIVPLVGVSFAAVALCFKSIGVINDVFGA